ncbi:hypothetical protein QQS21_002026 [Conoideocrella luteorostrata]|uniref:Uncharacterized protein n=1 Tax=Conoideocrella luteorostrata TaxID=1105319 RepID=A0AAJ0CVX2_9HYPO|nr:hypothetical protein QQS21_002026 [Conoideocrella luteorostrata]
MANQVKNYFLSPSWDYAPDGKPGVTIALWNIVSSPTKMVPPLAAATVVPEEDDTGKSTKTGFEWTREREKEKKFGVWTKFLNWIVGAGVDIGHNRTTSIHDLYTFKEMATKEAFPSTEYLEKMVKDGPVRKYLERFDFEKPVYVVVGTKAVCGTTVKQVLKKERSTDFKLSTDAMQTGVPISLGPEVKVGSKDGDTLGFTGSSDFVFAFRIRKIVVDRNFEIVDQDDETEGTALGPDDDESGDDLVVKGLEGRDSGAADVAGGKEETVEEDDEPVRITIFSESG